MFHGGLEAAAPVRDAQRAERDLDRAEHIEHHRCVDVAQEAWPTQPFPIRPRPLVPSRLTPDEAWGINDGERNACRARLAPLRSEGIFTPPSFQGTVVFPGFGGGVNWGSVSYDRVRGLVIAPTSRAPGSKRGWDAPISLAVQSGVDPVEMR